MPERALGSKSISRAKFFIERSFILIRAMITADKPKEDIEYGVNSIKMILADNTELFGEDYVIDKGLELESIWKDFLEYEDIE